MKYWCMFEQSGTFKNEFKKLGFDAVDLDILNDFGQTDYVVDLFAEIENAYNGEKSIFDEIKQEDLIFAFFPCTRFQSFVPMMARCERYGCFKNSLAEEKLEYSMNIVDEINRNYSTLCKLCIVCLRKNIKLIVENPYTAPHFLRDYFPINPTVIHKDRTEYGDNFVKPTQYFFFNCNPKNNFIFENIQANKLRNIMDISSSKKNERSMISPIYANRFIREHILDEV